MRPMRWILLGVAVAGAASVATLSARRLDDAKQSPDPVVPDNVSVRVAAAGRATIQSWIFAEGTARSVRRDYLTFENAGRVVFVKKGPDGEDLREGTLVEAGELLARQDTRRLEAELSSSEAAVAEAKTQVAVADAELARARTDHELKKKTLERYSVLLEQESASKQEYDEAKANDALAAAAISQAESRFAAAGAQVTSARARLRQTQLALEETELRATIAGVVAYVNVKEGFYFSPNVVRTDEEGAALQTIPLVVIDPTAFEVTANLPSYLGERIRPDQVAVVSDRAASHPDTGTPTRIRGKVFSVNPAVSPGGRAIQVKVRITENAGALKDGLFVSLWIAAERREEVVVIPIDALVYEDNRPFVFVVRDGVVERHSVTLGLQEFLRQEVVAGVAEGDRIVTDGRFQVSDGSSVRVLDLPVEGPR